MQRITGTITAYILMIVMELIVSSALAAFSVLSRMNEDRVFPARARGSRCPRLLHRGRLHLMLILTGLQAFVIALASLSISGIASGIGSSTGSGAGWQVLAAGIAGVVILVAAAVLGVGTGVRRPEWTARIVSYPLCPLYILFRPVAGLFLKAVSIVFPGLPGVLASPFMLFPEGGECAEGFIEKNGSRLVRSIVEFGQKKVREVMVPRIDIFAVDSRHAVSEVRETLFDAGHSRVPVYDGNVDRITGILYVKDLVKPSLDEETGIGQLSREPYFVPEGKKIDELLREFQVEKKHMAVVVDEYGGTSGIVTLEDILEEIVGEIRDEYDHEPPMVRTTSDGRHIVEGRISLDELRSELGIDLPSEEVETLGGFLFDLVGRVPAEGEILEYGGMDFTIQRLEGQRIAEVAIAPPE